MVPHFTGNGHESLVWPAPVRAAMQRRDRLETGVAMLESNFGFRALWTLDKRPILTLTPHGVADATNDPRILTEWSFCWPDCELALVPGERFAVVDLDDAASDPGAMGIPAGTWAERTNRGSHHFVTIGKPGRKAKLPGGRGDFLTGSGAYVIMSPSPDRWPVDIDAGIRRLADDSPLLRAALPRLDAVPALGSITEAHRREAGRVIAGMLAAPDENVARDARKLMDGIVPPGASPSEADYRLCLLATYHTDSPEVIAAVLEASGLGRSKWRDHAKYLGQTIARALDRRVVLAASAKNASCVTHAAIGSLIDSGNRLLAGPAAAPSTPHCELMLQFGLEGCRNRAISSVLAFLIAVREAGAASPFTYRNAWIRVPVCALSQVIERDRTTVWRALDQLESSNMVERQAVVSRVQGSPRADSFVRFIAEAGS